MNYAKLSEVMSGWNEKTIATIKAVVEAGESIRTLPRTFEVKEGEGHRSGITRSDALSQEILLQHLEKFEGARFLCEEDTSHPHAFQNTDPAGILETDLCFVLDSLDSTARYGSELDSWCVGRGVIERGEVTGSAVFAPATNNGFLVASEIGRGVLTADWDGEIVRLTRSHSATPPNKSVVFLGVDTLLYRNVTAIVPEIATNVRAVFTSGSGILGLARVAARRAQAIIQTPQKAWDWVAAYRAALETGNTILFFRLVNGNLLPVEAYDSEAFKTLKQNNQNRLGFVAGEPALATKLFRLLPKTGWERTIPDTVSGAWQ